MKMQRWGFLGIAFLVLTSVGLTDDLYVGPGQTYTTMQSAINAAVYGDTINVQAGTYIENITLKNGVAVIGEGSDKCIIDGGTNGPTVYSVKCDSQTILKNFTVTNGSGFINQHGITLGGGIYNNHSDVTINNCIFTGNSVEYGGGIYNDNRSNPEISNCLFVDNIAEWWGGGIVNYHYCNPKIFNCKFLDNLARYGGGVYNYNFCDAEIINCTFENNTATSEIYFSCGGGIYNDKESNSYISNCLFSDNTVSDVGGGLYNRSSSPTVINCTFNKNLGNIDGGAIGNFAESHPIISNCILWNNRSSRGISEVHNSKDPRYGPNIPYLSYCNITESGGSGIDWDVSIGIDGGNNIDIYPSFVNPAEKDFRLLADSPCIDTGDPNSVYQSDATDLGGNPRIINGIVDMGAYEFFINAAPVADAGADQVAYAWIDGLAEVRLDGTGSYDEDGDELSYFWYNDANDLIATGAEPNIILPVGEHVIELIVSDGLEDSEPNSCVITVIEPLELEVEVLPDTINRLNSLEYLRAIMTLPDGFTVEDVSQDPLELYPGQIEASLQEVVLNNKGVINVFGSFDAGAFINAVEEDGETEVTVAGKFISGQWFFGSDIVTVLDAERYRWEVHTGDGQ